MSNPLSNLPVTTWYKALAVVTAPAFLIALASSRDSLMLIFGGLCLFAIGEWRYHTRKSFEFRRITGGGLAKIKVVPREINFFGVLLQVGGAAAVAYGLYRAYSLGSLLN